MSDLTDRLAALAVRVDPADAVLVTEAIEALIPLDDIDGHPVDPVVSVLADMAVSLRHVVANTGRPDIVVTEDLVLAKWEEIVPLRGMYSDWAIRYVKSLGVTVEPS